MNKQSILWTDAIINLILGMFLLVYIPELAETIGVPVTYDRFDPTILGSILFGIGIALILEISREPSALEGLGLAGAIVINLCGGIVLAAWLILGNLQVPGHGYLILWSLVIILIVVSFLELITRFKQN
jgi:peptidoglycan/LPS O-acetylase OafA/YrhL